MIHVDSAIVRLHGEGRERHRHSRHPGLVQTDSKKGVDVQHSD
jgi:hypothetical protein